jgi:hypothetical protein
MGNRGAIANQLECFALPESSPPRSTGRDVAGGEQTARILPAKVARAHSLAHFVHARRTFRPEGCLASSARGPFQAFVRPRRQQLSHGVVATRAGSDGVVGGAGLDAGDAAVASAPGALGRRAAGLRPAILIRARCGRRRRRCRAWRVRRSRDGEAPAISRRRAARIPEPSPRARPASVARAGSRSA